jgi:hypothetical protein
VADSRAASVTTSADDVGELQALALGRRPARQRRARARSPRSRARRSNVMSVSADRTSSSCAASPVPQQTQARVGVVEDRRERLRSPRARSTPSARPAWRRASRGRGAPAICWSASCARLRSVRSTNVHSTLS